ncbi:MAG: GAF and HD-GYP domain-containing protein [Dehalococcoidia bacterium]
MSFLLVVLTAAGFIMVARAIIAGAETASTVRGTRSIVGAPVQAALDGGRATAISPDDLRRRADAVLPFIAGDVLAVRVWSGGNLLFSRGAPMPVAPAPFDRASARFNASAGQSVFATYLHGPNYVIEIDRPAAPIDNATSALQDGVMNFTAMVALLAFGLTQAAFWLSVRRWAGQHRRLAFMYTRGQQIRASLDFHDVAAQITHDGAMLVKAQYGFLALFEADTGDLLLRASYDALTGQEDEHQRSVDEWFLRRCVATNTTIISTQPAAACSQTLGVELGLDGRVTLLCVPMALRDRVIGALAFIRSSSHGRYGPAEVRLVEELADQAVMAVEQSLLFAKVRSYADELEMSYDTTLKVLMAALDTKDDATEGHCERVAKLTAHLARQMEIPEAALVDMERGALLHDVGKIGVPDAVLKKPKELNELEWEAMRKHPLLAGVMVGKVGFLEGALPILLYHHERYDGAGYPFGLVGDKIPLDARIFSIVDSYDAMTSDRPYRKAMSHEEAMAEVRANSGTQFDPLVVVAFEELMATKPHLQVRSPHPISRDHIAHDDGFPAPEHAEPAA